MLPVHTATARSHDYNSSTPLNPPPPLLPQPPAPRFHEPCKAVTLFSCRRFSESGDDINKIILLLFMSFLRYESTILCLVTLIYDPKS